MNSEVKIPEKFLPVGSVVKLKGATKRIMIVGFSACASDDGTKIKKVYDYSGCMYPVGLITQNDVLVFNHDDIEELFALGYENDSHKELSNMLNKILSSDNLDNLVKQINEIGEKEKEENE